MNLTQLRYLAAIVDSGLNITAAAERVYATQSGISKQIRQLEDELHFRIFTRKGRSLSGITPAGAKVIEHARAITEEAANIRVLAANLRRAADGALSIATTHTQARYALPAPIARFNVEHPGVSVHLMPGGETEILGLLEAGEVDFSILSTTGGPPPGYRAIPLYRWRRTAIVPHDHPLAGGEALHSLEALADCPLVSYESVQRPDSSMRRAFEAAGFEPRVVCTARDADLIKTYVRAGLGVGVLAEMAMLPEDAADLYTLELGDLLPECTSWLLAREDRLLRDYALGFILALAPQLDQLSLRRVFENGLPVEWPSPPDWQTLRRTQAEAEVRQQ
ncbi:MAG: LysR substrate-binding domain-containing protein [Gammaproteobacteria bacterium]